MRTLVLAVFLLVAGSLPAAQHVVVVVLDGLRPDLVNETDTPTLAALAKTGVFFANHHAVFLSSTVVNGTAIATGCYPARSGTLANSEYRPALNATQAVSTATADVARNLGAPTLAELLQQAGQRTAVIGAKTVALVHDPRARGEDACCANVIEGRLSLPESVVKKLTRLLGICPADASNKDDWCTAALIGPLWDEGVPAYSLLWLSQPDVTQHETSLGSAAARKALRNSDNNLRKLLDELDARGVRQQTAILVVSDHGFSTISRPVDLPAALTKAGFRAGRTFAHPPAAGDVLVLNNGTASLLYVAGRDATVVKRLVEFLQQQDFTGVLLTRQPHQGAFTLDQARINTPHPPDIVLSFRWRDEPNPAGIPGLMVADSGSRGAGQGAHGSLSRYDMHNTLIAAGPDFQKGMTNILPSSNADLAPTVLHLLGIKPTAAMDGRVLAEALVNPPKLPASAMEIQTFEAAAVNDHVRWTQYLKVTDYAGARYLDEGNGAATVK